MPTIEELEKGFSLGEWEVLPKKGVLRRGNDEVRPEPKVLLVLLVLAKRDGDLVTKDELIEEAWDGRAFGDEPIQRCIALLRRHFQDTRPFEYIETLQRRGYRLLKRVRLHEPTDVPISPPPPEYVEPGLRKWKLVAGVIAIGFLAVSAYTWLPARAPAVQSIAILPMDNLSGDPANQYIVEGIKNSLAHRLSELPEFTIKNVRQTYDDEPSEIAAALKVESVLITSLQMQGDLLKVTWHIVNGIDNVTVGSGEVTGDLGQVFGLQEQMAQAVRSELAGSRTPQLVTRPEPASAAYNSFMRGMYLFEHRGERDNLEAAMELFQESISLDENYGPAYLALATAYALLPPYRHSPVEEAHRLAIATAEAGVKADDNIEEAAGSIYGFVYHQQKNWRESEAAHLRAVNAPVVDSNSFNWYSRMLASVGRLEDALTWALAAEDIDPDNPIVNSRIAIAYMWLGETERAQEYFQRAGDLGAGGRNQLLGYALLLLRQGRFEQAQNLATAGAQAERVPTDWVRPVFAAFADPAQREMGLEELGRQWADKTVSPQIVLIARGILGDIDGAMDIAQLLEMPGEAFEMELLFIPEMEPLRKHPGFVPLMQKLGVLQYWDSVGCLWVDAQVLCATD